MSITTDKHTDRIIARLQKDLEAAESAFQLERRENQKLARICEQQRRDIARLPAAEQTLIEKLTQLAFVAAASATMLAVPFAMLPDVQAFVCSVVP